MGNSQSADQTQTARASEYKAKREEQTDIFENLKTLCWPYLESCEEVNELPQDEQELAQLASTMKRNDIESFTDLLATPGKQYIKAVDARGYTLIHRAIEVDRHEIFDLLLEQDDAPLMAKSRFSKYYTPLTLAIKQGKENFAEKLVMRGADAGSDPVLIDAVKACLPNVTKLLINRGAEVNVLAQHNETPLMMLCSTVHFKLWNETHEEILYLLLEGGADVFLKNYTGYTVFDIASENHLDRAVMILFPYMIKCGKFNVILSTPFHLMKMKSPIAPDLFNNYIDKIERFQPPWGEIFFGDTFLEMFVEYDSGYLRIFMEKFTNVLGDLFKRVVCGFWQFFRSNKFTQGSNYNKGIDNNLVIILDNPVISARLAEDLNFSTNFRNLFLGDVIPLIRSYDNFVKIVTQLRKSGLKIYHYDLDRIYASYGFCSLFDELLHQDFEINIEKPIIMPHLIYNPKKTLKLLLLDRWISYQNFELVFYFFAVPELRNFFVQRVGSDEPCYNKAKAKLETLPNVPSLCELARDCARDFFVYKFSLQTYVALENFIENLELPRACKDIILFKKALY